MSLNFPKPWVPLLEKSSFRLNQWFLFPEEHSKEHCFLRVWKMLIGVQNQATNKQTVWGRNKSFWESLVKPNEIISFKTSYCLYFFVYCDSLTGQRQVSPKPFGSEIHFSPTEYLLRSWEICKLILSSGDWVCPGVLPGQPFHRFPLGCEEHLLMRLLPWFPLASKSYLLFINSPLIGRLPTLLHPIVTSPGFETIKATELEEKGLCCQM